MANKKSKKKVQTAAEQAVAKPASKAEVKKTAPKKDAAKKAVKKKPAAKTGVIARIKKYITEVRSEMKRVTWPTKKELVNYSVAVCASLVVVGIAIALLDAVISQGLVLFSGLRG